MIVDYGLPLSGILAHLEDLVGPHAYDRHDIRFPRDGYEERKEQIYARMQQNEPDNLAGSKVVRTRTDDGYKFYLDDGSWVLMRMSGTEPLMRVYAEATTPRARRAADRRAREPERRQRPHRRGRDRMTRVADRSGPISAAGSGRVDKPWGYELRWAITDRYAGQAHPHRPRATR